MPGLLEELRKIRVFVLNLCADPQALSSAAGVLHLSMWCRVVVVPD